MADAQPLFGRRFAPDPRDRMYPMRLALDPIRDQYFRRGIPDGARAYRMGKVWVQGETGTCVEHGWRHRFEAGPIMQPLPYPQFDFYRKLVARDEWNDNDHEATGPVSSLQSGTSVRAGAEQAKDDGLIKNYLWAESVDDIRAWHMLGFGPNVLGLLWKSGMMKTDSEGFVSATGSDVGGHCVCSASWTDHIRRHGHWTRALEFQQSWPLPWGRNGKGRAYITIDDLATLLGLQGEACAPIEQRIVPAGIL